MSRAELARRLVRPVGAPLGESLTSGILSGQAATNLSDQYLRRTNVSLRASSSVLASTGSGYDTASRLQTVSDGINTASYSYLDNSSLAGQIGFARSGTTRKPLCSRSRCNGAM